MAATVLDAWPALDAGGPSGSPAISSGSDRVRGYILYAESNGAWTVDTFTIGTVTFTAIFEEFREGGSSDTSLKFPYWNEAAVASRSGDAVSYNDSGAPDLVDNNNHVTMQDVDQTTPIVENTAVSSSTDALDVDTPGVADDWKSAYSARTSNNRDITDWDGLTEEWDDGAGSFRASAADGSTTDDPTTVTGDGPNGDMLLMSIVFKAPVAAPAMLAKMLEEGHING